MDADVNHIVISVFELAMRLVILLLLVIAISLVILLSRVL